MPKSLTTSKIDRQNILNNSYAVEEIEKAIDIKSIDWDGQKYLTKNMVANFYNVDIRTIERYISKYNSELESNGYRVLKGKQLESFLSAYNNNFATDINVGSKVRVLSVFDFRAFLNIGMFLVESETAAQVRSIILDIVIDTINQRSGGSTKYINQRERDFIGSFVQNENYRQEFTDALRDYVDMGNAKYAIYTNKIYVSFFKEKAHEYKEILNLSSKDRIRDTLYSEVLDLISSYEHGLAVMIEEQSITLGRKLNNWELSDVFESLEMLPVWKPLINQARKKMASRDMALREAIHYQLKEYIEPLDKSEYEKFLGDASEELEKLLSDNKDVLSRLKESN